MPSHRPRPLLPAAVAVAALACEAGGGFDRADRAPPRPEPIGDVIAPSASGKRSSTMTPEAAAKCGRGTGRNPDGECVGLGLLELETVQRVQIPAGEFVMGHVPEVYDARPSRAAPAVRWSGQPPRYARVDSFWIDLHEVPRGAYEVCVAAGRCTPAICPEGQVDPAAGLSPQIAAMLPQTCVTHPQAAAYCAAHEGRLPTEAEWEMAARGPDARVFPWGNHVVDELPAGLYAVGRMREDLSYYGVLGMGSNATEWVADPYDADAGLRPFLGGAEFRDPEGPLARSARAHARRLACGDAPTCEGQGADVDAARHVLKVSIAGLRRAAYERMPAHPEPPLEGWDEIAQHPRLGFRCAGDLVPGRDTPLTVPANVATVPLTRSEGALRIFGGVAEAVSQAEARRFCELLTVAIPGGDTLTGWRLPTLAELQTIASVFRGPGPFWTADGAAAQEDGTSSADADDEAPWQAIPADPGEALAARCVREG